MLKEHDLAVLTADVPAEALMSGDVGTVVHIYSNGQAYEVEFFALDGHTTGVVTLENSQVRAIANRDLTHTRGIQPEGKCGDGTVDRCFRPATLLCLCNSNLYMRGETQRVQKVLAIVPGEPESADIGQAQSRHGVAHDRRFEFALHYLPFGPIHQFCQRYLLTQISLELVDGNLTCYLHHSILCFPVP
jgi:hypothetical protein